MSVSILDLQANYLSAKMQTPYRFCGDRKNAQLSSPVAGRTADCHLSIYYSISMEAMFPTGCSQAMPGVLNPFLGTHGILRWVNWL